MNNHTIVHAFNSLAIGIEVLVTEATVVPAQVGKVRVSQAVPVILVLFLPGSPIAE